MRLRWIYFTFIISSLFLSNMSFSDQEIKILNKSIIGESCIYRKYDDKSKFSVISKLEEDIDCIVPGKENENVRIILSCSHSTSQECKRFSKLSLKEKIFGEKEILFPCADIYSRNDYRYVQRHMYFYEIKFYSKSLAYKENFQAKDSYTISLSSAQLNNEISLYSNLKELEPIIFDIPKSFGENIFNGNLINMTTTVKYRNYWMDTSEVISVNNYNFGVKNGEQIRKVLSKFCHTEEELKQK